LPDEAPAGLGLLDAGFVAKERGRNYENQKRTNAGIRASAALPGGITWSVVNQGSVDDALIRIAVEQEGSCRNAKVPPCP